MAECLSTKWRISLTRLVTWFDPFKYFSPLKEQVANVYKIFGRLLFMSTSWPVPFIGCHSTLRCVSRRCWFCTRKVKSSEKRLTVPLEPSCSRKFRKLWLVLIKVNKISIFGTWGSPNCWFEHGTAGHTCSWGGISLP